MTSTERERITALEVKMVSLCKKVDELDIKISDILTNHLPHLHEELAIAKLKLSIIVGGITFLATFIADRIWQVIFK